jgi:hypothetical protein
MIVLIIVIFVLIVSIGQSPRDEARDWMQILLSRTNNAVYTAFALGLKVIGSKNVCPAESKNPAASSRQRGFPQGFNKMHFAD